MEKEKIKRVIWIILDSVGMGELPDASLFDDVGTNTIGHVAERVGGLHIPNMVSLGLGNIDGMKNIDKADNPIGCYARMAELSNGKDTTIGHWEMTGIYSKEKFPTYPIGFPKEIIDEFVNATGVPGVLGNIVASGTEIIKEYGDEHIVSKKPIIYTSADSVFQIACHEDVYSPEELYEMCVKARAILKGKDEVGRVIARPFVGKNSEEGFIRTSNRRDFSRLPDKNNLLSKMKRAGLNVAAVGKIEDIFANQGITTAIHTKDNLDGVKKTLDYMNEIESGLIFTNLVEFDSKWGHRNDYEGYAKGLEEFDIALKDILESMKESDLLFINADHGCDPTTKGTDHTREYVPLLIYGKSIKNNVNLGTLTTFADTGQTIAEIFEIEKLEIGTSFLDKIV
ncbi:MAG: phosphopentomutase [Lachnospiraceae bacterium]|nr:phosphopentomutase [Lachnospiraceae bacterium]